MIETLIWSIGDSSYLKDEGIQWLCRLERILFDAPYSAKELTEDEELNLLAALSHIDRIVYKDTNPAADTAAALIQLLGKMQTRRAEKILKTLSKNEFKRVEKIIRRAKKDVMMRETTEPLFNLLDIPLPYKGDRWDDHNELVKLALKYFAEDDPLEEFMKTDMDTFKGLASVECYVLGSSSNDATKYVKGSIPDLAIVHGAYSVYKQFLAEGYKPTPVTLRCALCYGSLEVIRLTIMALEATSSGKKALSKVARECVWDLLNLRRNNVLGWVIQHFANPADNMIEFLLPLEEASLKAGNVRALCSVWHLNKGKSFICEDILRERLVMLDYVQLALHMGIKPISCMRGTFPSPSRHAHANSSSQRLLMWPFLHAAECGDMDKVKALLREDGNILWCTDHRNRSALYFAARNEHTQLCAFLVERGLSTTARKTCPKEHHTFNISKNNHVGWKTPFVASCLHGHLETARALYDMTDAKEALAPDLDAFSRECPRDILRDFLVNTWA